MTDYNHNPVRPRLTVDASFAGLVKVANEFIYTTDGKHLYIGADLVGEADFVKLSGSTLTGPLVFTNNGVRIKDTDGSHNLIIVAGSNLTADRNLTIVTGDAARNINLSGNPTLGDWFDQSVKAEASPAFVTVKCSGLTAGKIPYHVDGATGFADGPTKTDVDSAVSLKHTAVTVSAPISLSGQALSLVNDAGASITEIDTGTLASSDTVIPSSNAVKTAIAAASYPSGSIIQVVNTQSGSAVDVSATTIPYDDTIPQQTEGVEVMTRAITPGNANNALIIDVCIQFSGSLANEYVTAALFQDSTANALKCATRHIQSGAYMTSGDVIWFRHVMTAGTTSSTIFKVRIGSSASDSILTVNGESLTRRMGGVYCTSITIMEVKA